MTVTETPDVSDDVEARLSRAYNGAYIACAANDTTSDFDCHRAALRAVVAHLRSHPEDAAAVLGIDPDDWSAPSGLHTVRCGYDSIEFSAPCTCRKAAP